MLFMAFKAASIVIAKIQADVLKLIQKTPPKIPLDYVGSQGLQGSRRPLPRRYRVSISRF